MDWLLLPVDFIRISAVSNIGLNKKHKKKLYTLLSQTYSNNIKNKSTNNGDDISLLLLPFLYEYLFPDKIY